MLEKLQALDQRYRQLEEEMVRPEVAGDYERLLALAKERASLEELVGLYRQHRRVLKALEETRALLRDGLEEGLAELAREEAEALEAQTRELEHRLRLALLPKDPNDEKSVFLEVRAGAGGEEASLFAGELFRMYTRYAQRYTWRVEVVDSNQTGLGGFKEIIFEVDGKGAYSRLKYESGVHRVQRVPATEASGRIHTSTTTVAVLPEAEEVEVQIHPADLRVDVFHAGGHGGQNVNKVATAVRIVHLPTGITAVCQDERSQLRNRQKAMAVLRARLLDQELRRQREEIASTRQSQVGTGERAEKVRTYNFSQNRVTDHRIGLTLYDLQRVLDGNLDELVEPLIADEQSRKLQASVS